MNETNEENDIHLKFFQEQFQSDEEKEVIKKFLQIYKTYKKEQQILNEKECLKTPQENEPLQEHVRLATRGTLGIETLGKEVDQNPKKEI